MYSISNLCREFHLSRSTLLYYDSIGLLTASNRTKSNYRQYSIEDKQRLEQICSFREAGVPLSEIKEILEKNSRKESDILSKRFHELNREIRYIKLQQKLIVEMLKSNQQKEDLVTINNQTFTSILKSVGLDDKVLDNIHVQFEKNSPDAHQLFLEFLGLSDDIIKYIREESRQKN